MRRVGTTAVAVVLCAALALFFGGALTRYSRPLNDNIYDLSLTWTGEAMPEGWTYDQKGWTVFTVRDGERRELTANGTGGFYGDVAPGEVFYFSRTLTEDVDAPTLQLNAYDLAVAVFLDGELLYSDGQQQGAAIGDIDLAELGWTRSAPVLVSLPEDYLGRELTIAQNAGDGEPDAATGRFMVYPCEVSLSCGYAYESGLIAESFSAAIPAALLLAAGLFLLAAFAAGAWRGRWNWPLFCAALFVFLWMAGRLANTSFFSFYHPALRGNAAYLCRCFALSALLAFLASRAKRLRTLPWTLAALNAACSVLTLCMELSHDVYTDNLSVFLRDVPFQLTGFAGLIAAMVCAWLFWRREGRFYRLFAWLTAIGLAGMLLYAALFDGRAVLEQLQFAFVNRSFAYFLWLLMSLAVTAAAIAAIAELVGQEMERRVEARQMAQRDAMALASYESMRAQHEQVMMLCHDMNRHLHVLRQLTGEDAAQSYLDELIGRNEKIPVIVQSGNQMIDIILNGRLASAAAGIEVEILHAQAPETLPLSETDLCSLMLNLVDNAIAAASAPGVENPRIRLDLRVKGSFFVFTCENSCAAGKAQKKEGHGLGLKIVEGIAERYDCLMEVERAAGMYRVTVAIPTE